MVCTDSAILVTEDDLRFSLLVVNDNSMTIREAPSMLFHALKSNIRGLYLSIVFRFFIPILDFLFVFSIFK